MCLPPALKKITNKDHLIDTEKSIDKTQSIKNPKRVSFEFEEQKPVTAVTAVTAVAPIKDQDPIFFQMFVLTQMNNKLQIAFERIATLEKKLEESISREKLLTLFCEKHNKAHLSPVV